MNPIPLPQNIDTLSRVTFEISPCQSEQETSDLIERLKCLQFKPALIGISCHNLDASLALARQVRENGFEVMLHIPGGTLTESDIMQILDVAQSIGLKYILALRGDQVSQSTDFPHAANLVNFIRSRTGTCFRIAVCGYPDTHPDAVSPEMDIAYLKEKVDCGADFIISQVVFSSSRFNDFVNKCREAGITIPIVPGILLIKDSLSLHKFERRCRVDVPEHLMSELKALEGSLSDLTEWSRSVALKIAHEIFDAGTSDRVHFFVLNRVQEVQHLYTELRSRCREESEDRT